MLSVIGAAVEICREADIGQVYYIANLKESVGGINESYDASKLGIRLSHRFFLP